VTSLIRQHNALARKKEPLHTNRPDWVTRYVCGPTVHNDAHIGSARPAVLFDVLSQLLRHDYSQVIDARNLPMSMTRSTRQPLRQVYRLARSKNGSPSHRATCCGCVLIRC